MNPLVKSYLRQITESTAALNEILSQQRETIAIQQESRDALQKQVWSRSKENIVLQGAAADYDELKQANTAFREREAELAVRLRNVLAYSRALTEEIRR